MIGIRKLKSKRFWIPLVIIIVFVAGYAIFNTTLVFDQEVTKIIPQVKEYTASGFVRIDPADRFGGVLPGLAYHFRVQLWILHIVAFCVFGVWILFEDGSFGDTVFYVFIIAYFAVMLYAPVINFIPADFSVKTGYDISNLIK